ncbi:(2Fe-2S)-binding protein [Gluconacetobacter azotocaptans]|uniref:(2Fe-2S)-binding protein n=1 Tax=Gluconacetobacter azotocaptans TaxID=142834 RepID=A0A7W4JQA7_9PROT|nr:(2Fe-2S)-binding protein [Gluconacetobacter azotocaptans]MBB2188959.1 (2Fe-2S)-binding protein [Gluconacetobacter azotocaptans]MBM9401469.1 (2Fe-2S)-binding protein [Gluconacetobacter azotocaptans]GBQ25904.1 oxidoreductase iron-sulfur subunit [Gluconacetobacter azotocaptans DSM 13594]
MKTRVTLTVNGQVHDVEIAPHYLLSDVLRDVVGLTATHVGCEQGVCGACTVLVDDRPARACLTFAIQMEGHEITTLEGLRDDPVTQALQQAFHERHALQCGFCTPGFLVTLSAWLKEATDPTPAAVRDLLTGNLCRCTGYQNIVEAVLSVAATECGR